LKFQKIALESNMAAVLNVIRNILFNKVYVNHIKELT